MRDEFADNDLLRSPGLKQFFDGVSSTHTAWLSEPYSNAAHEGECGAPVTDPERMRTIVLGAAEEGFAVRIHTIGDKAIHTALDIFEEAREKFGAPNGQNGLEHLENFLPGDIERLAELDVCANCQPPHTVLDPNGIERDLGPERAKLMWPYKSYLDAGVKFSFGTDSPVVDINSREVIYDAVTRQSPATGEPAGGWAAAREDPRRRRRPRLHAGQRHRRGTRRRGGIADGRQAGRPRRARHRPRHLRPGGHPRREGACHLPGRQEGVRSLTRPIPFHVWCPGAEPGAPQGRIFAPKTRKRGL